MIDKKYNFAGAKDPINISKEHGEQVSAYLKSNDEKGNSFNEEQFSDLVACTKYVDNYCLTLDKTQAVETFINENRNAGVEVDEVACNLISMATYFDLFRKKKVSDDLNLKYREFVHGVNPMLVMNLSRTRRVLKGSKTADETLFLAAMINNYNLKKGTLPKDLNKFVAKVVRTYDKSEKDPQRAIIEDEFEV